MGFYDLLADAAGFFKRKTSKGFLSEGEEIVPLGVYRDDVVDEHIGDLNISRVGGWGFQMDNKFREEFETYLRGDTHDR